MEKADIISLNLALNSETEKILSKELINKIKPGAVLINTSPMELLDFHDLADRLKKGDISFTLDHSDEMTEQQLKTLGRLDNCIIYPAIGYLTKEANAKKKRIYIKNLTNFIENKPTNLIN